jgi:hypothetical protein
MASEQGLVIASILFILFWMWTLDEGHSSLLGYAMRSVVVVAYQILVIEYDRTSITVSEWIANFLVWSHWASAVTVFLFPDPRFKRKRIYA